MNEFLGMDNLMDFFKITSNPVFAQYYNNVLQRNENFNLDMHAAKWAPMQNVFTYEVWEQYDNIEVMATFLDLDSDPHAIGGKAQFSKYTGSIPRHKAMTQLDEPDYRDKLEQTYGLMASAAMIGGDVRATVSSRLEEYLYDKLSALPTAHKNTLNYMIGQRKSKLEFELTANNNPQGIKGLKFASHVPENNRKTVKFWTITAEGQIQYNEAINPVEYIQQLVYDIKNDPYNAYNSVELEMNRKSFKLLMKHPVWAKTIAYALNSQFYLTPENDKNATAYGQNWLLTASEEQLVNIFKQICDIESVHLYTAQTGVEFIEKMTDVAPKLTRKQMECFDEGMMIFHPTGNIIDIIPVAPMRPDRSAISTTIFGGRGILEYWYEPRYKQQFWRSELTCLPVFTAPRLIYHVSFVEDLRPETILLNSNNPVAVATVKKTSSK